MTDFDMKPVDVPQSTLDGLKTIPTATVYNAVRSFSGQEIHVCEGLKNYTPTEINSKKRFAARARTLRFLPMRADILAALAGKAMTASGYERNSETGYERAFTFRDYEGFERYDTSTRSGSKNILVGNTIHIQVSGRKVDDMDLTMALEAIDYTALIDLKVEVMKETRERQELENKGDENEDKQPPSSASQRLKS